MSLSIDEVLVYVLPYPPSVNQIWRMWQGRMILSEKTINYRAKVAQLLLPRGPRQLLEELEVRMIAQPPNDQRRDLDNLPKPVLDAMQYAKLFKDDSQVKKLTLDWGPTERPHGKLVATVRRFRPGSTSIILALAERVYAQSELLTRSA